MNKSTKLSLKLGLTTLGVSLLAACSSTGKSKSGQDLATTGPTIVDVKTNPGTFEVNRNFQPNRPPEIIAEVKDFTSPVSDVRIRFVNVPMEIPMEHVAGTTWRAVLTPEQLKQLAVGGQTMNYQVRVVAKSSDGMTTTSADTTNVAVKTPSLATDVG